ncbi:hypothetical protein DV736_g6058, partial [Chaetothyriales sp. CBS 134916]
MGLSPWEVITFLPKTGILVSSLASTAFLSPFRGSDQAKTLGEHIQRKAFRAAFDTFSVGQLQAVLPPTETVYRAQNKKLGEPSVIVDVPNTTIKGFWIGDRDKAAGYLVYFHGGGFVIPAADQHVELLRRIVKWTDGKIAVFVPCYTLSPHVHYPQPIREAAEAVKYVAGLASADKKELSIAGDSAGGNLVLAILSLLAGHACEDIAPLQLPTTASSDDAPVPAPAPLKSALAIAPWVSSDYKKFPQMVRSSTRDILTYQTLEHWSAVYKGARAEDGNFISPEEADPAWWEPVKGKVGSVLVVTGDDEVLRDPVVSWYSKFEQAFGKDASRLLVAKHEIHDHPLNPKSEAELGVVGEDEAQEGAIKRWVQELSKD